MQNDLRKIIKMMANDLMFWNVLEDDGNEEGYNAKCFQNKYNTFYVGQRRE